MSATAAPPTGSEPDAHAAVDPHGHDRGPYFAHHFESWKQQFDAGKLGMWAFLVQEVLFFSGLFCAYTIYRTLHPEVFEYADQFLSVPHGAFNTIVLLFSSLTMAWGVRCSMLGQRVGLIVCLAITLSCAALFLGVKAYEYSEKYHAQLIWAGADPTVEAVGAQHDVAVRLDEANQSEGEVLEERLTHTLHSLEAIMAVAALVTLVVAAGVWFFAKSYLGTAITFAAIALMCVSVIAGAEISLLIHHAVHDATGHAGASETGAGHDLDSSHGTKADAQRGAADAVAAEQADESPPEGRGPIPAGGAEAAGTLTDDRVGAEEPSGRPQRLAVFFSIYYAMTGVHALHILGGMAVITWLLVRSVKGHFTPEYFGPVDFVGLYWHLVDLVWIYLFPLLYLIG